MIQFLDFRTQMADGDRGDFVCRIGDVQNNIIAVGIGYLVKENSR